MIGEQDAVVLIFGEQQVRRYNRWRPHKALGNLTPAIVYQTTPASPQVAAGQATLEAA